MTTFLKHKESYEIFANRRQKEIQESLLDTTLYKDIINIIIEYDYPCWNQISFLFEEWENYINEKGWSQMFPEDMKQYKWVIMFLTRCFNLTYVECCDYAKYYSSKYSKWHFDWLNNKDDEMIAAMGLFKSPFLVRYVYDPEYTYTFFHISNRCYRPLTLVNNWYLFILVIELTTHGFRLLTPGKWKYIFLMIIDRFGYYFAHKFYLKCPPKFSNLVSFYMTRAPFSLNPYYRKIAKLIAKESEKKIKEKIKNKSQMEQKRYEEKNDQVHFIIEELSENEEDLRVRIKRKVNDMVDKMQEPNKKAKKVMVMIPSEGFENNFPSFQTEMKTEIEKSITNGIVPSIFNTTMNVIEKNIPKTKKPTKGKRGRKKKNV
jgi:hypothetical protein